jgi:hypothetical protein
MRRQFKELLLKPLLFWSMKRDIIRLTGPFLWYSTMILSIPDLVICYVKYLLNFYVRYTEEEGYLNLEP